MSAFLLLLAAIEVSVLLLLPAPLSPEYPGFFGGIQQVGAELRGDGIRSDFAQDYVGAQRMLRHQDAYPVLEDALPRIGIHWRLDGASDHPPTAFLLAAPLTFLSWRLAAAVWAAAMLIAMGLCWTSLGLRAPAAAALVPVVLLWPPAAWSVFQLTPIWLLGLALAWRWRDRPFAAGAAIALASLTKFVPALSLLPFLVRKKWSALAGFVTAWGVALGLILIIDAPAISQYVSVLPKTARAVAARPENASMLTVTSRHFGVVGVVVAAALVLLVLGLTLRRLRSRPDLDPNSWHAWTWAGVALLPIAWVYSLLPLLPGLVYGLRRRDRMSCVFLAGLGIAVSLLVVPFTRQSALPYAMAVVFAGLALGRGLISSRELARRLKDQSGPAQVMAEPGAQRN
jgi:hypothetical protein